MMSINKIFRTFKMMNINKIFQYLLALAGVITCMACSDSADRASDDGYVRVVFQLYMPSSTVATRAGESDWEYAIDKSRLHVVFYSQDGRAIGGVEHLVLLPTQKENEYQVTGSIKLDKLQMTNSGFSGKVMVYANIDGVNEQADFSEDNLNRLTFTYQPTTPHFIPMWGVKQLENIPFEAGKQYDIKTINLLRAEAKIHVSLRQDMIDAGYTLTQVNLVGTSCRAIVCRRLPVLPIWKMPICFLMRIWGISMKPLLLLILLICCRGMSMFLNIGIAERGLLSLPLSVCGSETDLEKSLIISSSLWIMMMPAGLQPPGQ